jgi:hypothetical protein
MGRTASSFPISRRIEHRDRAGTTPEQSEVKGAMRETIQVGLKYLSDGDLEAIADYLIAQPPIVHEMVLKR